LQPHLDDLANALVEIENYVPVSSPPSGTGDHPPLPPGHTFYFKIPPNDRLLEYWSTVATRLFDLRHCRNIEGITQQTPLFDPPIDPALLARARSAGVDLTSVLSDVEAPLPNYRFGVLYERAQEYVAAVADYGAMLLAAIESRDAETLQVMMATAQKQLLDDTTALLEKRAERAQKD